MDDQVREGAERRPVLVVGIGASAGGIDALQGLFQALPADTGIAFVVILHLEPSRESHVAEILAKSTPMSVRQVEPRQPIERDHVYVIAPNSNLRIQDGVLITETLRTRRGVRKPVDALFSSLAADQKERAVAIVLSGTGNNGTAGAQDIKAGGGMCIAQDPETAEYDGMPRSLISSGAADHVLRLGDMPRVLIEYGGNPHARPAAGNGAAESLREMEGDERQPEAFQAILRLLERRHGLDLGAYKPGTLRRRTERRMGLKHVSALEAYLEEIERNPDELDALYHDVLIGVTHFFRDHEAWDDLGTRIVPRLVAQRLRDEDPCLRAWAAGCATGEEAYSLAILCLEGIGRASRPCRVQVYATDVNAQALSVARQGWYPAAIQETVSAERLGRFFDRKGDGFRVTAQVRDTVTFAVHNLLTDPPFSKLDLVACRNVLIYLDAPAQARVTELLHFALRTGGVLMLGSSESIGRQTDLFETVSKKHRIYRASPVTRAGRHHIPQWVATRAPAPGVVREPLSRQGNSMARQVERAVLDRYTSACVATNRNFEILYFFGPTEDYLERPAGEARLDLLSWARPGLYAKLRGALESAVEGKQPVTVSGMRVERDGAKHRVECIIEPLRSIPGTEGLFLVIFRDVPEAPPARPVELESEEPVVRQLEAEIKETRQELQNTVEELERTNEDYRSSHEELLSLNEELQSSNEELETSKEELQSLNEEMTTLNRQLEEKNAELRTVNADLNNLLMSTGVPTIFLDRNLRVRRFTPAATEVMRLVDSDIGRSIEHIKERVRDEHLVEDARAVLEKLSSPKREVSTDDGRWYTREAMPYRTDCDRIDGVTVTFVDITDQKRVLAEIESARKFADAVVQTVRTPLLVLDQDLRVVSANRSFYRVFRGSQDETENALVYDLGNGQWDVPRLRELLEEVLLHETPIREFEIEHDFEHFGRRSMLLDASRMDHGDSPVRILLSIEDVTSRKESERSEEERARGLMDEHRRKDEFIAMLGHELRNPVAALGYGVELLAATSGDAVRSEEIRQMMTRQQKHLGRMLDQLLDVARVVSSKVEIAKDVVDLAQVIREAVEDIEPLARANQQQMKVALPSAGIRVMGDRTRLFQVLDNLLTNAVKYSDAGGEIRLTAESIHGEARITVEDQGAGIDPGLLPHIFDAFTQEPRTLDRSKGGLGLGLGVSRRLVELHGGRLEASSRGPGLGSAFVVTLPALLDRSEDRDEGGAEPSPEGHRNAALRVLIVEDSVDVAATLAMLLETKGHTTLTVHDGPAALEAARRFRPDVVLLDLGLPEMNGYEVAARLREEPDGGNILLIALTGYGSDEHRLREAGFDRHLLKPPDLGRLLGWLGSPAPDRREDSG